MKLRSNDLRRRQKLKGCEESEACSQSYPRISEFLGAKYPSAVPLVRTRTLRVSLARKSSSFTILYWYEGRLLLLFYFVVSVIWASFILLRLTSYKSFRTGKTFLSQYYYARWWRLLLLQFDLIVSDYRLSIVSFGSSVCMEFHDAVHAALPTHGKHLQ